MAVGATPAVEAATNDGSRVKTYAALGRRHGRILLGSASLAHSRVAKEVAGPRTGERGGEVSGHDCGCGLHACDIQRVVLCYCLQLDGTADGDLSYMVRGGGNHEDLVEVDAPTCVGWYGLGWYDLGWYGLGCYGLGCCGLNGGSLHVVGSLGLPCPLFWGGGANSYQVSGRVCVHLVRPHLVLQGRVGSLAGPCTRQRRSPLSGQNHC